MFFDLDVMDCCRDRDRVREERCIVVGDTAVVVFIVVVFLSDPTRADPEMAIACERDWFAVERRVLRCFVVFC